jgi:hypothetical protein
MTMAHLDFGLRSTMFRAAESIYENGKFSVLPSGLNEDAFNKPCHVGRLFVMRADLCSRIPLECRWPLMTGKTLS